MPRDVAPDWDRWVGEHVWSPEGTALIVAADDEGRRPVFRIDVATSEVRRLTRDSGHHTDLQVSPDGKHVFALRDAVDAPPAPPRALGPRRTARLVERLVVALVPVAAGGEGLRGPAA